MIWRRVAASSPKGLGMVDLVVATIPGHPMWEAIPKRCAFEAATPPANA